MLADRLDHVFTLSTDTFRLLAQFARPRTLDEVCPDASPEARAVIAELVEQAILLREDTPPALVSPPIRVTPTIFGVPRWSPEAEPGALVVLGCRYDGGTRAGFRRASADGPTGVRAASARFGWRRDLATGEALGFYDADDRRTLLVGADVRDAGDLVPPPAAPRAEVDEALRTTIIAIRASGAKCALLGGDHSVSLAAIQAIDLPAFGVIHIDAHPDLAEVRAPGDLDHANVMSHVAALPQVEHLLQLGPRGLLPRAQTVSGVQHETWSVDAVRKLGPRRIAGLCRPNLPYYLSIDLDALDPSVAAGTGAPEPGGFTSLEARRLVRCVTGSVDIVGLDLVEVAPPLDPSGLTTRVAVSLFMEALESLRC